MELEILSKFVIIVENWIAYLPQQSYR
uniref:Uncharacterized protein n=1 Tax=Rhizophora mucronata TaxID=61149 RepID=A0A2P2PIT9_RHIMU